MTPQDHLVDWLRDAYAMEVKAEAMLGGLVSRLEVYPSVRMWIEQHLRETVGQQALLESGLRRLASGPSLLKGMAGEMAAFGQVVAGMTVRDEVIKGAMNAYVFEHTEVAAYKLADELVSGGLASEVYLKGCGPAPRRGDGSKNRVPLSMDAEVYCSIARLAR
ncbi:hypothetical protein LMG28727_07176 [Paraburkholderia kirstenboschensis]|uniref:DUF892 family protein n=1 Tax=Paraburkholderia kirstenboschensis TaxID=1245436 RepID=UPI000B13493D|nr:DUF892 family protein [Paraburkholderia kirstenboschensis]CAD6560557.1 hypothetical protein LMG28727_07176 [Paraburkholderia kirstenboschensis]